MAKFRASMDFAAAYASNKQGIGEGIDNFVHLKVESVAGTFVPPSIGTQGSSTSAAAPSTDVSASSNRSFRINVDGLGVIACTFVSLAGLTTGNLIAAALETLVNTALSAAGYDSRVWVVFTGGLFVFKSQKTGTASSVVITNGASLDIATELKIGTANTGVEVVGTAGGDYLWQTKCSMKASQPFEISAHKSGRQATNIIKKKKVAEGDIETYINAPTSGDAAVDTPLALLLEGVLGRKLVIGSTDEIRFDSFSAPSKFFSIVQGNNAFGRFFNGAYGKKLTVSLPGSGEAKMMFGVKARDGKYASIAQASAAVVSSASFVTNVGESKRFEVGARVMVCDDDGRTIVAGADGALSVLTRTDGADTVGLSATVSCDDNSYLVPWLPHCFDQAGTDNPITGLVGTVSFDAGSTTVEEIRSVEFTFDHKVSDFDDFYGADGNRGFVVGDRAEIGVKIELLVSASQANKIVQTKAFETFAVKVALGDTSLPYWEFNTPKVYFEVPDVEIPDSGPVVMVLQGKAVQSLPGLLDAFYMRLVTP